MTKEARSSGSWGNIKPCLRKGVWMNKHAILWQAVIGPTSSPDRLPASGFLVASILPEENV